MTQTVGYYVDAEGNQIWICPACGKQDDGSPMIGCDECEYKNNYTKNSILEYFFSKFS